jgi:hypothetical protein
MYILQTVFRPIFWFFCACNDISICEIYGSAIGTVPYICYFCHI